MVIKKNLEKKFALISVYNKDKLAYLCENLSKHNFHFISTGSTGNRIRQLGFKCLDVSKMTKFKEMLDGRVKTLNPKIYSSILYIRNKETHRKQFLSLKIPEIDMVIVNLYPFEKFINANVDKVIEMIDIGGPSLLRAAAKNYKFITTITNVNDYSKLISNLKKNNGFTDNNFRKFMSAKTFKMTYEYDKLIYKWFNEKNKK